MPTDRVLDLRGVFQVPLQHVVHAERDRLRDLGVVRCFGFDTFVPTPICRRKVPGGTVKIVFAIDGTINGVKPGPKVLVVGMQDRAGSCVHEGHMYSTQIVLNPLAAGRLLGVPMAKLRNRVVDLDQLVGTSTDHLLERIVEADCWRDRFAVVGGYLRQRAAAVEDGRPVDRSVVGAMRMLHQHDRGIPVSALAAELGLTPRHLSRLFSEQVGLPPKIYSSLLRFSRVLTVLSAGDSLASAATRFGYHDQAHLNRHFQRFAQCTPTALLAD